MLTNNFLNDDVFCHKNDIFLTFSTYTILHSPVVIFFVKRTNICLNEFKKKQGTSIVSRFDIEQVFTHSALSNRRVVRGILIYSFRDMISVVLMFLFVFDLRCFCIEPIVTPEILAAVENIS